MSADRPSPDPLATIPASAALDLETREALTATRPGLGPIPRIAPVAPLATAQPVEPMSDPAPIPAAAPVPLEETLRPAPTGMRLGLLGWHAIVITGALAAGWNGLLTLGTGVKMHEADLLLTVAAFGALGGTLHAMGSLALHAGRGTLRHSWWLYYLMLPLGGAALAPVLWIVLRSGFGGVRLADGPDGQFAALAWGAISGLFAALATQKLRDAFSALFRPGRPYRDG